MELRAGPTFMHRTWLFGYGRSLFRGVADRAYNVGSMEDISIAETARAVSDAINPTIPVHVAQVPFPKEPAQRYVPDTRRAQGELGLQPDRHAVGGYPANHPLAPTRRRLLQSLDRPMRRQRCGVSFAARGAPEVANAWRI